MYLIVLPEFYTRFCLYPVHALLVVQVMLSVVMLGLCLLFVTMEPVPELVKWSFHLYGLMDLPFGLGFLVTFFLPGSCAQNEEVLSVYIISLLTVIGTLFSIAYFAILAPLWVLNSRLAQGRLVDPATKDKPEKDTTLCNKLINVLPCLWHV
ncbi:uncharacterized protein LOC135333739 isoform X2 [Halichondria panicea]